MKEEGGRRTKWVLGVSLAWYVVNLGLVGA